MLRSSAIFCVLTGCISSPFSFVPEDSTAADTGVDPATMTISGTVFYQGEPLPSTTVGLVYVATDGTWEGDVSMVTDQVQTAGDGRYTVTADQLSSYWVLAERGQEVWSGVLAGVEEVTLDEFGESVTVDIHLQLVEHAQVSTGDSCECLYHWSHLNYTCCPTDGGDQICSWLWDNCSD